ncbi:DUF3888 domain-containing protein [Paenibacillus thalictri]|uniref:DUF3888 domain-containing protein n=1 Tax=Paenibacillus thalictri TaxID=2527873 RepID=A0A4Q9DK16_9BACL|nr:DUF3888 domain-containing protein [Paenibacillus thalictri]TBL71049.1 DUF3888 domain-containing protein [Paenibacillus thalictri]
MKITRILLTLPLLFLSAATAVHAEPANMKGSPRYEDLAVTLLTPYITKEINQYYSKTLKNPPHFAPYYGTRISIESPSKEPNAFLVTVHVVPYIGAHVTVGEDDITFTVNPSGEVSTTQYTHTKDYKLPPSLADQYIGKQ